MDHPLIQSNSAILMGKPVIAGTRITVESILLRLAAGETIAQLLAAHPHLTLAAIQAALAFTKEQGLRESWINSLRSILPR
jgi:uncharacterized protein (DUF433 family)